MADRFVAEKRRYYRYQLLDFAKIRTHDATASAVVVDVGLGGVQLRCRPALPVGRVCQIVLNRLGEPSLALQGRIRHTGCLPNSELHASGVEFTPRSSHEQLAIAEFVHGIFQDQYDNLEP